MPTDAPKPADLDAIAAAYPLGAVREIRYLPDGRMNRNWFLDCDQGRFALKHLTDRDPAAVARNLGLLKRLAAEGVPVAPVLATSAGELVYETAGNAYYLCAWIDGTHPGADMSLAQARHMGETIARIHTALAAPDLGLPAPQPVPTAAVDPEAALAETGRFLELAANSPVQDDFDRAAVPLLHDRRALIAAHAHLRPGPADSTGPEGWTHGDCQDFNLIWSADRVEAVIDWDRIRVGSYALELVRAAAWQFCTPDARIDLDKVAAFLTGYRAVRPIDPADLANAARHRWWRMLAHCWHLDLHYNRPSTTCDHLFFEDHRLITWWSANLEAVEAAFGAPDASSYTSRTERAETHWAASVRALPLEGRVKGRVYRRERFGIFIDLDGCPDAHGFADIAGARCRHRGLPEVGARVSGWVRQHNDRNFQITVRLDWAAIHDPWGAFTGQEGDVVTGTVTKAVSIGVFVAIGECIEGLVPAADIEALPSAVWAVGASVRVRIVEVDLARPRLLFAPA
ncbi:phosphotransferase [Glycomyces sp. NPDC048151]|uniref:phosphotransferase n=1 Tax=Glycomyces sp. NPDC048151 TaxID=3364002 RepID=UPI0037210561